MTFATKNTSTNIILELPEKDQNKIIHEGIVLATGRPIKPSVITKRIVESDGPHKHKKYDHREAIPVVKESALKPGDHVLFPHWCGLPVEGFSSRQYRVVKEEGWMPNDEGGIFAVVEEKPKETSPEAVLASLIEKFVPWGSSEEEAGRVITERFLLVDRQAMSVTLTGT